MAYFGLGSGPIHREYFDCNGGEMKLSDCLNSTHNGCTHSQDVGVLCPTGKDTYTINYYMLFVMKLILCIYESCVHGQVVKQVLSDCLVAITLWEESRSVLMNFGVWFVMISGMTSMLQ